MLVLLRVLLRMRSKPAPLGYPSPKSFHATFIIGVIITLLLVLEVFRKIATFCSPAIFFAIPPIPRAEIASSPPDYTALRQWEARLPQHNLDLPYPEGRHGRYVLFSNSRANRVGWNNKLNEMLMNTWLAHESNRGYVFHDFAWQDHHYPWNIEKLRLRNGGWVPNTPLNALVSGPSAGGSWEAGDPAPRSISEGWFDIVCPKEERKIINARDVKSDIYWADGRVIFDTWRRILADAPERCVEVVASSSSTNSGEGISPETFDLLFWSGNRSLSLWEDFVKSPVSRLLVTSPVVQAVVDTNIGPFHRPLSLVPFLDMRLSAKTAQDPFSKVMAIHVRRGDFKQACIDYAAQNFTFYSWNLLPIFSDPFALPSMDPENLESSGASYQQAYLERCLPDADHISRTVQQARKDYLRGMGVSRGNRRTAPALDVLYIMSNDNTPWLDDLKARFQKEGWSKVITNRDLRLSAEGKEVSVAVDMEYGRKAAVFVGNGWSSFTSNVIHRRLVDRRDPISIRFW